MGCDDKDSDDKKEEKKDDGNWGKELLQSRSIIISEEVSEELAQKIYAQLLVLNQRSTVEPIYVYLNTPGGDADSGFGIYDMMRFVEAPVVTIVAGLCASAGVTIFLGADPGKNFALPNARFLLHQPSTGVQGQASDLEITANEINKTRERYNQVVAAVTGRPLNQIRDDADRDFWMSAEEARQYGLVAKIITRRDETN
ncbi:ATP-dependent Clp protease proteolytic subunit 2 [Planctomycetales bacterium]|nr:ATP-dependent Clp protease proteolytic subunit 2 [Planctomycetales bacterium]GHS96177.1 ATP-dependent Clp protease proteolytic subunit 2 [Planctomycetales bacterium]GHT04254.1 ATP-dependent Clp protease proteolytic subunit 2 [Planctomycetales bacterium]GHV19546.1 ATP-dependent Clp protease proteolytic subunit 2 [Planctomycetales bacterium]